MITRRKTEVVIYQGDDLERMAELKRAADKARSDFEETKARGTARVGDLVDPKPAEQAYNDFVDEAAERAESVWLEAIGRKRWRQLKREHAARRETRMVEGRQSEVVVDDDVEFDVNTDTFPDALLAYHDPATGYRTIIDPAFPTKEGLAEFLDDLSDGDFERLWQTAFYLNTAVGADPKQLKFSEARPSSSGIGGSPTD